MLKKLHIAILMLLCGLAYMTQDGLRAWNQSDEPAAPGHSSTSHEDQRIFQYDNSQERYVDWNTPEIAATGTEVMPPAGRGGSGTGRSQGSPKIPLRNPLWICPGRASCPTGRECRETPMRLFPSGVSSPDHQLIILRKLVI